MNSEDIARERSLAVIADLLGQAAARLRALDSERASEPVSRTDDGRLLLKVADVADRLALSRTKVWGLISSGELPVVRIGRSVRVPTAALGEWVDRQVRDAAPAPEALLAPTRASYEGLRRSGATGREARLLNSSREVGKIAPPTTRRRAPARAPRAPDEPYFEPWMPRPMLPKEYREWIQELERDPEAYAEVLWKMEVAGAEKDGKKPMVTREEYGAFARESIERRRRAAEQRTQRR